MIQGTIELKNPTPEIRAGDRLTTGLWHTTKDVYVLIEGLLQIIIFSDGRIEPFNSNGWYGASFTRVTGPATLTIRIAG
jgi:hypothetical protein